MSPRLPRPTPIVPGPDQESAWDYPEVPRLEPVDGPLEVWLAGRRIAHTTRGIRLLERGHPPVYFFPPYDVDFSVLSWSRLPPEAHPHVGAAWYLDVTAAGPTRRIEAPGAAYAYTDPSPDYAPIAGWVSYYAGAMDGCRVRGETVVPQEGGVFNGWITRGIVGPFKGAPGSDHW